MAKTPEELLKLLTNIQEIFDKSFSKEETFTLLNEVIDTLTKRITKLSDSMKESETMGKKELERIEKAIGDAKKELQDTVKSHTKTLSDDFENKLNELLVSIEYVQSCIKEYDDTEMREHMEEIKGMIPQMPEQFDPSEIVEDIEELEKKYEELEKKLTRIGSSNGGVTNMRIQQAFKYILKTEAPVGAINGSNTTYTVSQPIFAILSMSLNGEVVAQLPNYTINGKTITFSTALPAVYSGKDFEIKYV